MDHKHIILASASPRRQEMLTALDLPFLVRVSDIDEQILPGETPGRLAVRLSQEKAQAVAGEIHTGIILSADTLVVLGGIVLGKPNDRQHARDMLVKLRGQEHDVISAVTVIRKEGGAERNTLTSLVRSNVRMRRYSDEEIEEYLETGDAQDKAGAYAIQHSVFRPAEALEGCYASVMGLPLCHLYLALQKAGLEPPSLPVDYCRQNLKVECHFYPSVFADPSSGMLPG